MTRWRYANMADWGPSSCRRLIVIFVLARPAAFPAPCRGGTLPPLPPCTPLCSVPCIAAGPLACRFVARLTVLALRLPLGMRALYSLFTLAGQCNCLTMWPLGGALWPWRARHSYAMQGMLQDLACGRSITLGAPRGRLPCLVSCLGPPTRDYMALPPDGSVLSGCWLG